MKPIRHENCLGVRGIKTFKCIKCGKLSNNYMNGVDICFECCVKSNICQVCGKDLGESVGVKDLSDTIKDMLSSDYEDRFRAEYFQLKIRMDKLSTMLKKYKNRQLPFTPKCSYDLLNGQLKAMKMYAEYLEERAHHESISLKEDIYGQPIN